jgi:hypothetical protein
VWYGHRAAGVTPPARMEGFTMRTIRRMEWLGLAAIVAFAVAGAGACGSSSPPANFLGDDASTSSSGSSGGSSSSGLGGSSGSSSGVTSSGSSGSSSGSSGGDDSGLSADSGDDGAATDGAPTDGAPTDASTVDGEGDTGAADGSPADSGSDGTAPEAGPKDAGLDSAAADGGPADAGHADAGPADAGHADAGSITLRILNFAAWCSVTVNGDTASTAFTITKSVPAGSTATIVAKPASTAFEIGPDPWFGVDQNDGGAAPGTDVGTGVNETSTVTVTAGANHCVSVCCQEPGNSPLPCPTTNPCP